MHTNFLMLTFWAFTKQTNSNKKGLITYKELIGLGKIVDTSKKHNTC